MVTDKHSYRSINISRRARGVSFDMNLHLLSYFLCMGITKALACLCISPDHTHLLFLLLKNVISTKISCAGSYFYLTDASLTLDWTKFPGISM